MKDYYRILGVPESASQQTIKSAFRRLAFKYHPDTSPDTDQQAEARFKEINEAYGVLSDRTRRQQYDFARKGQFGFQYSQQDIFRDTFANQAVFNELSRMFAQRGLRFDRDFLSQVFFGGRGIVFQFYAGPGGTYGRQAPRVPAYQPNWMERIISRIMAKLGRLLMRKLLGIEFTAHLDQHRELELTPEEANAGGKKELSLKRGWRKKKVMVTIPPGVKQGTRIRLKEMGLTKNKGAGDLYLHIKIKRQASLKP